MLRKRIPEIHLVLALFHLHVTSLYVGVLFPYAFKSHMHMRCCVYRCELCAGQEHPREAAGVRRSGSP